MANEQNLIPQAHKLTVEEASRGGKRSAEVRRKRKSMREQAELLLSLPLKNKNAIKQLEELGIDVDNTDNQMAMLVIQWNKALKGDLSSLAFLRDMVGEKPKEQVSIDGNITSNPLSGFSTDELKKAIELMKNDNNK